jgi:hypothetical protein
MAKIESTILSPTLMSWFWDIRLGSETYVRLSHPMLFISETLVSSNLHDKLTCTDIVPWPTWKRGGSIYINEEHTLAYESALI